MTCQGNTRLLMLIEWCTKEEGMQAQAENNHQFVTSYEALLKGIISTEKYKGHGNSFHGMGGRGTKLSQLRYSLRLLLSMCSSGDGIVHTDLHEQGATPLFLGELNDLRILTFLVT